MAATSHRLTPAQRRRADRFAWLALHLARPFQRRRPDAHDELESAAMLGLTQASLRWRAKHGVKFQTYAKSRINGAMLDELERLRPYGYRKTREDAPHVLSYHQDQDRQVGTARSPSDPLDILIAAEEQAAYEAWLDRLRKAVRAPVSTPAATPRRRPAKPLDNRRKPDPPPPRSGSR